MIDWFNGLESGLHAVLTASWQASVLAVIVLTAQSAMGRWLSPHWRYALWSVVVIRLMMPVAPGSALSVFNLLRGDPSPTVVVAPLPPMPTIGEITYSLDASGSSMTAAAPAHALGLDEIALIVWLAGIVMIFSVIIAINLALMLRLRRRAAITDPELLELVEACKREMGVRRRVLLYDDPKTTSPALAGIFRPALLIPPGLLDDLPRNELRFILLHELAHVKKHDIAQNWLLIALSAVHWFNPVVWFAFARLRADRELARDAMVLNTTGTNASQAYGQTIIHTLERITHPRLNNPALAGIGDGMGQLKRRLRMIALAPKRRPALTFIGITLLATLAVIGLTDAAEPEAPPNDMDQTVDVVTNDEVDNGEEVNSSPRRVSMKNLLNLGAAIHMYAANNDDQLPPDLGATLPFVERRSEWTEEDQRPATPQEKARMYLSPQDQLTTNMPASLTPEWINEHSSYVYLWGDDQRLSTIPGDVWDTTVILHEKLDAGHPQHGRLVATLMCDGHVESITVDQAEQMIAKSRTLLDAKSIQIRYELCFLLTPERFFEEAGIDLGVTQLPEDAKIQFIDDLEANVIRQAVQKNPSAATLNVSQVIQLNGRKFQVLSEQKTPFMADYVQVEGESGTEYEPVHDVIIEGAMLTAEATVSADMRFLSATLHPIVTNVAHPLEKQIWKDSPPDQSLFVEVPKVTRAEEEITVSIPDQGTLLLDVGTVSGPMNDHDPVEEGVERRVYMLIKPTIRIMPDS